MSVNIRANENTIRLNNRYLFQTRGPYHRHNTRAQKVVSHAVAHYRIDVTDTP